MDITVLELVQIRPILDTEDYINLINTHHKPARNVGFVDENEDGHAKELFPLNITFNLDNQLSSANTI